MSSLHIDGNKLGIALKQQILRCGMNSMLQIISQWFVDLEFCLFPGEMQLEPSANILFLLLAYMKMYGHDSRYFKEVDIEWELTILKRPAEKISVQRFVKYIWLQLVDYGANMFKRNHPVRVPLDSSENILE